MGIKGVFGEEHMKKIIALLGATALTATAAHSAGIDRSGQSVGILFEKGNYAEYNFGRVSPKVSGISTVYSGSANQNSGDMSADYNQFGGAVKLQFNDSLSGAIIVDNPFGADVNYPAGTTYFARGATADLNTFAITGLVRYKMPSNLSVYGGIRYQTMDAKAAVPFVAGYTVTGDKDGAVGYVVGVAYEKPEIALRVALTYNSKIKHELATSESSLAGPLSTTTTITTPQSFNLEFQSGVAKDTLVFGSVRWVEWSKFDITPTQYNFLTKGGSLVAYRDDRITYALGVGRRLNPNWAVSASVGYERSVGGFSANLGPTDGKKSVTLAAVYTKDAIKITGGISYVKVGDAQTTLDNTNAASNFTGNKAIGVGVKVGYSF